jgi:hypothetical protein
MPCSPVSLLAVWFTGEPVSDRVSERQLWRNFQLFDRNDLNSEFSMQRSERPFYLRIAASADLLGDDKLVPTARRHFTHGLR